MVALGMAMWLGSTSAHAAPPGWEVIFHKEGVEVARKDIPGQSLVSFRGEGVFSQPIAVLAGVLVNHEHATEWIAMNIEHRLVKEEPGGKYYIYEMYDLPWPIQDRDYYMQVVPAFDDARKVFSLEFISVEDPSLPPAPCCIRAVTSRAYWRLEQIDANQTRVAVEVHTDPKGLLPSWMVNWIQRDWPWATIAEMVEMGATGQVPPHPRLVDW